MTTINDNNYRLIVLSSFIYKSNKNQNCLATLILVLSEILSNRIRFLHTSPPPPQPCAGYRKSILDRAHCHHFVSI